MELGPGGAPYFVTVTKYGSRFTILIKPMLKTRRATGPGEGVAAGQHEEGDDFGRGSSRPEGTHARTEPCSRVDLRGVVLM